MAEIDDALPNTKTTVELPSATEIIQEQENQIQQVEGEGGPVEITMDEEGGAEISFDPKVEIGRAHV